MSRRKQSCGFTLIELLMVVAIIGILMGLLLVAVLHSRSTTRLIVCQSNMRQWSLAMLHYADAHHGDIPRRGQGVAPVTSILDRSDDWFNALPPFMETEPLITLVSSNLPVQPGDRSVWMCPELVETTIPKTEPPTADPMKMYFAYGMNMWLSAQKLSRPDNINKVGAQSTMVFLSEGNGFQSSLLPADATKAYNPVARHNNLLNIAFLDGHIVPFTPEYVGCDVGIPDRPDIRWIVPDSDWLGPSQ
jgi:prepilin-type N-terminal cleavage/methylation domain-containing protein/prepilin-type processing-associated H-X9-DG protein